MSRTCMEFVPKRKFADRHVTDGEQALAGGTKVVWACSAGLSAKIDDNAAFGDVWHATSGLEEGRAQHGHSSGAHSTPRNQCRDARGVARWLFVHCQGISKAGSILDVWVPAELQCICEGSLKGNGSLLNAWAEML